MATKGLSRRALLLWMAWARISLPVPLSPWIRTLMSVGAIRLALCRTLSTRGLRKM